MSLILDVLAFIFDPIPNGSFMFQNHFIYLFIIIIAISIFKKVKGKKDTIYNLGINYSILGLVLVGLRYEHVPFFSMRAIFATYLLVAILHMTTAHIKTKRNALLTVEGELKKAVDPYKPRSKKKMRKNKKNGRK